jgi:hypothetical protein
MSGIDPRRPAYVESTDGTPIAYDVVGSSGPVLVLVEPPLRHRAFSAYEGLVPLLAERLTVVIYDRRGRGDSGDAGSHHPDRETEDLDAVIGAVGGTAGVYGYSAGALVALRAAGTSSRISGLVVLEPPLHDDADPRPDPLTVELAELVAHDDRAGVVRRFHEAIGVPDELIVELSGSPAWGSMVDVAHTAVYDCMISDAVNSDVLASVTQPTLVLDSAGTDADLSGWAATVAALLPVATHRSLPGDWHTVADDVLAPVIVDHIIATADPDPR